MHNSTGLFAFTHWCQTYSKCPFLMPQHMFELMWYQPFIDLNSDPRGLRSLLGYMLAVSHNNCISTQYTGATPWAIWSPQFTVAPLEHCLLIFPFLCGVWCPIQYTSTSFQSLSLLQITVGMQNLHCHLSFSWFLFLSFLFKTWQ